jgi:outer membrane receptor protein involved in Fe transport
LKWFFICLFVLCLAVRIASTQESIHYASVGGHCLDASGAAVEGARVSARNAATNQLVDTKTDGQGRFRFAYLRPGRYEITVQHAGFAASTRSLTLTVGAAFELAIALSVAATATDITVTGEATMLEAARSQVAETVSQAELQHLPLSGRSFLDAALVAPGVSPTNTGSNQLFAETAAVPGQGISIGSQRNLSNSYIVDGLSDNDDAAGLTGAFYGLDVVQEVQVVTSVGQAEFGRALGGYVNVVTKSGTNALHGDLYGYLRNSRFNAANALARTALPMTQAQYGASMAGPLVRDRTFYFADFEQRALNQTGLVTISPANVAAINTHLAAVGYPGARVSTGIYPNPVHSSNVFGKVDHRLNARNQFTARYSLYRVTSVNSRGAGGLSAPSASANLDNTDHVVTASNILVLSPRAVNETRGQYWQSTLQAPPSDPIGPAVSIAGVASFGTLSGSPTGRRNKLGQLVDNFSHQAGAHAIRFGTEFLYNDDTITFPRSYRGSYSFSSLANFLSGAYNNAGYTQTFANSIVHQRNPNIGAYGQDEWKVNRQLTLNLGLRYDLQFLDTIALDKNNISPRAGFAWAARKTVVRGGYGLYYDRVPLRALANALLSAHNTVDPDKLSQISISLSPAQAGAPVFPNVLSSLTLPPAVLFNFSTMDRHMQNAYSQQGALEIEQQLGSRSTVSIGYQHIRGLRLIMAVNQNAPSCEATGMNNGCRPDPSYANDSQYSPRGDSHYDALYVSLVQRPARWGQYRVSYTFSKALTNVGAFFFSSPINNFNIWEDYGRSDDDQRRRLVVDGSIHSPRSNGSGVWARLTDGFTLSAFLQYYSALPFNITTGAQTIQGTAARPTVNGTFINRNAGEGSEFFSVAARLSRTFQITETVRLEALAEGFNVTNHLNVVSRNGTFGTGTYPANPSPAFNRITAVGDPRHFQFGVRMGF